MRKIISKCWQIPKLLNFEQYHYTLVNDGGGLQYLKIWTINKINLHNCIYLRVKNDKSVETKKLLRNNNTSIIFNGQVVQRAKRAIQNHCDPGSNTRFAKHLSIHIHQNSIKCMLHNYWKTQITCAAQWFTTTTMRRVGLSQFRHFSVHFRKRNLGGGGW